MKEFQVYLKQIQKNLPDINYENKQVISFSQFSKFQSCPKSWELRYIHKHRLDDNSIHLIFGTAFHATLQHLLFLYYKKSVKIAEEFDFETYLKNAIIDGMNVIKEKSSLNFTSPKELTEFYHDGVEIIKFFKKKRSQYFTTRNYELVGIEIPLFYPIKESETGSVYFLGYIDFALKDKRDGRHLLFDIKTSTSGWNDYKKKDSLTTSQLVAYKIFYSKQYNIDIDMIDVQYFIVKRKIRTDIEFPQKRIQKFRPAAGKVTINRVVDNLNEFVNKSFNLETNSYEKNTYYPPLAGKNFNNCKFCKYNEREDLCPSSKRIHN